MAATYPGVIPYRSSSPSSPDQNGGGAELIKVNHNFSLKRPGSMSTSRSANASGLGLNHASNHQRTPSEEEEILRERYYQYWAQQQQVRRINFLL